MADVLASALVSTVLGNLNASALQELSVAWGLESELENLKHTFTAVQAVLQDAEKKQWKSEAIKNWLRDLKDAAYDADDVLDEFAIEAQRRRDFTNRVRSFFSLDHNPFVFRIQMAHRLKTVRERFDAIAKLRHDFELAGTVVEIEDDSFDWRQTGSLVDELGVYGRKKEKEELINKLLTSLDDLSVYAVCGMGGLGKTTLAQLVYNDESVNDHFDLRIWAFVCDDFDVARLARAIIGSIDGSSSYIQELDHLQRMLQEKVIGKRFLLVLDDIWDHHHEKWSRLKDALRFGARGSVVVITTRIETVALQMGSVFVRHLHQLSDDDSWHLFEQLAFGTRRREEYKHLESVGKAIVSRCGGVPLAIKVIGNLMRSKRTKNEWLSIKESEFWDLRDEGRMILSTLKLSYNNLPPHLKQCFALCSLFRKDYEMKKDQLVELWMANGCIPCQKQVDLHEIGYQMFDELVRRSFFQDVKDDGIGNITCKMHDLLHDLAKSISIWECCLIEDGRMQEIPVTARHVAFFQKYRTSCDMNLLKVRSMRSLLSFNISTVSIDWRDDLSVYLSRQKHLRTLNLSAFRFQKFPMSVATLRHLRHLDVSKSQRLRKLPESIIFLHYLQTLNLRDCRKLYKLPKGMQQMKSLIYLDLRGCDALHCMPAGMGQLTFLWKLSIFIVGNEDGHRIGELQRLNHISGELSLKDLNNVRNLIDAQNANLMRKTNLQSLSLFWREDDNNNHLNNEDVLCGLCPHSDLKKLHISGFGSLKFPDWMVNLHLQKLVEISLESCNNCKRLPPFGKLQFLKHLTLRKMDAIKCIGSDLYGDGENPFPLLEYLTLGPMKSLEHWETSGEIHTCLHVLSVLKCPKLVTLPAIPSVKKLIIQDCGVPLLRSVAHFSSLTSLTIEDFSNLVLLPDGLLQNNSLLKHLRIDGLRELESLSNQLDNLSSLKLLQIVDCYKLESLPKGLKSLNSLEMLSLCGLSITGLCDLPSSLATLHIQLCYKFTSLSEELQNVKSLKDLYLCGCPKLNSLPESIQHLTSLQSLQIHRCEGLSSLPNKIGRLVSLSRFDVWRCPKLTSLPEEIRSLDALRELHIRESPNLERRCQKEKGEDWPKIAHIPTIVINNQLIQSTLAHED